MLRLIRKNIIVFYGQQLGKFNPREIYDLQNMYLATVMTCQLL